MSTLRGGARTGGWAWTRTWTWAEARACTWARRWTWAGASARAQTGARAWACAQTWAWRQTWARASARAWAAIATAVVCVYAALPAAAEDLYSRESYDALAADHRALRVGDNLTVVVTEITSSSTDARTTTDKAGAVSGAMTLHQRQQQAAFNLGDTFDGGGTIERTGKLLARLTVVVQSVEPNGNVRVKGEQNIVVNGDKQKLVLEGRVRPQDIAADNTVVSSRLSDARISYTGDGVLSEKQRQGILTRILSWLRIF